MSSGLPAGVPISERVCVCQRRKNSERKKSHFGFSSCYPFYHLVAIFMAEFYLSSGERRRESIFRSDSTGGFLCVGATSMTTLTDRVEAS